MNSRLFAFALLLSSSAGLHPANAEDVAVMIKNFDYSPMELNIAAGTTRGVEKSGWRTAHHRQPRRHVPLPALDQNDSFRFTFDKPGTYKYICSIHPKMKATITVH